MAPNKILTDYERGRVDEMKANGMSNRAIASNLGRSHGSINNYTKKVDTYGAVKSPGRPKPIVRWRSQIGCFYAVPAVAKHSSSSAAEIASFGVQKDGQMPALKPHHMLDRMEFARNHMTLNWNNVIFSDEKKFNLDGPDGMAMYWHDLRKESRTFSRRGFGGGSVMIWAAFCASGTVGIAVTTTRIDALFSSLCEEKSMKKYAVTALPNIVADGRPSSPLTGTGTSGSPVSVSNDPKNSHAAKVVFDGDEVIMSTCGSEQHSLINPSAVVITNESIKSQPKESPPFWTLRAIRFQIAVLFGMALAVEGWMRTNINMTTVCMINKTAVDLLEPPRRSQLIQQCSNLSSLAEPTSLTEGEIILNRFQQQAVLFAFYLGACVFALGAGWVCAKLEPKRAVLLSAAINTVATFISVPLIQWFNPWLLIGVRFIMGAAQSILMPAQSILLTRWFPRSERTNALAIITTGNQISVIIGLYLTAILCEVEFLGRWQSSFYVFGLFGVIFGVLWWRTAYDSIEEPEQISPQELAYLREYAHPAQPEPGNGSIIVLRSIKVWAVGVSCFAQNFMNVGTVVYLPAYYKAVLQFPIAKNGFMSILPFIVQLITKFMFSAAATALDRYCDPNRVAKLFNLLGSVGPAVCYYLMTYCDCNSPGWAIFLVTAAVGLSSGFIPGYNVAMVNLAPRYAGSIASSSRMMGQLGCFVSPLLIGMLTSGGSKEDWNRVFYMLSGVLVATGAFFQLFGSAEIQPWGKRNNTGQRLPEPADSS